MVGAVGRGEGRELAVDGSNEGRVGGKGGGGEEGHGEGMEGRRWFEEEVEHVGEAVEGQVGEGLSGG